MKTEGWKFSTNILMDFFAIIQVLKEQFLLALPKQNRNSYCK